MGIDIGLIAYNKYSRMICDPHSEECNCTPWSELGKIKQDAWRHAAVAVLQYIDKEQEQWEKDKVEDNEAFPNDY